MDLVNISYTLVLSLLVSVFAGVPYPLDPLTPDEIQETVDIVRSVNSVTQNWAFNWITLKEPEKHLILPYFLSDEIPPSHLIPRKALVIYVEKTHNIVNEIVVNLNLRQVESWKTLPTGTQTTFSYDEGEDECEPIAKADPVVQERCREMGWTDMDLVWGTCWGVGYGEDRPKLANAIRPVQVYLYGRINDLDNPYAHPFDFVVTVDLATKKVILIDNLPSHAGYNADNRTGNVCLRKMYNYDPALVPEDFYRKDVHPIYFSQPEGASYTIRGNEVTWQKFKFRVGFNAREGLSIHHVSFQDGPERRPLFYRMSIAELFVPYGDPRPPYHQKFAFDMGEWNLGMWAIDLQETGFCRGGVVSYLSFSYNTENGDSVPLPNAVCIYEEDNGVIWAHQAQNEEGSTFHARSTRLTVSILVNEDNYDYMFSWRFYQDATIEFNTELHGIVSSQLMAVNVTDTGGFGVQVAPQINAQFHQHHLAIRLDTEIDGNANTVSMLDIKPLPDATGSEKNPYGNGFKVEETVLKTAAEARTLISPLTGRSWMVRNPERIHPYTKKPVGWKLMPFNGPPAFIRKDSPLHHRCAFTDYNVWVTKYKDGQLYPYGLYENGTGLPEWVDSDPEADVTATDVVLWYIYGFTHIPRAEDWPVMPVELTGFMLKPTNFFLENPAMDVRPEPYSKRIQNLKRV